MIRDLYRVYRNEHWLSGVRLWVDAYRDFKAWRLRLERLNPNGEHRRKVRSVRRNREFYTSMVDQNRQYGLAYLAQMQNSCTNMGQYQGNAYLNGLAQNQGSLLNRLYGL